jgi:Flp pilus assembly protein TadG
MLKRIKNQRGAATARTAITLPLILLITVGIFEFGRAYQTWQVLTNAAREGARIAVLPRLYRRRRQQLRAQLPDQWTLDERQYGHDLDCS